jgi:outer membrane protein assembly factor BamB
MRRILTIVILLAGVSALLDAQARSTDWTQWRGPNRDGVIPSFTPPREWPQQLVRKWKVEVGLGYATPIVVGNRVYLFSRQGDNEVMSGLDADSGKVLWQTTYPAVFTMHSAATPHGKGPKSTPVFANGRLYSIGMTGVVTAFNAADGRQIWQKPGSPLVPTYTSHAFSPLVTGGLVIFHVGGHNKGALTAYDVNTGDVKWAWSGDGPTFGPGYGSPVVADFGGTRQIVTITQSRLVSLDAATGALLWDRPFPSNNDTNSGTPIVYGQTLIAGGNNAPTVALSVARRNNQWAVEQMWDNTDIPLRLTNGVIVRDALFTLTARNSGQYVSVDAKTGKTLWMSEGRQAGNAAISTAGDVVLSLEDDGELVVVRSSQTAFEPVRRYKVADTDTWAQPAISGNRIFVKDVASLTLWTLN